MSSTPAVGVTICDVEDTSKWYENNKFTLLKHPNDNTFVSRSTSWDSKNITIAEIESKDKKFIVKASLTASEHCYIQVSFYPTKASDLWEGFRPDMEKKGVIEKLQESGDLNKTVVLFSGAMNDNNVQK